MRSRRWTACCSAAAPTSIPARYGGTERGSTAIEPARDALEAEAWAVAQRRGLPVLGICRGFQAINVFSGGSLLQHVDGHLGPAFGKGAAMVHPVRVAPGTRLARILFPTNAGGGVLRVNSYHHQAVRRVGPGARARRQRVGEQPGRRPRRRPRGRRRALRVRAAVPSRAIGIDAGRVRAAVQGLRRRGSRPGRSPLSVVADRPSPRWAVATGLRPLTCRSGAGRRHGAASTGRRRGGGSPRRRWASRSVRSARPTVVVAESSELAHPAEEQELVDLLDRPVEVARRQAADEGRQAGRLSRAEALHEQESIDRPGGRGRWFRDLRGPGRDRRRGRATTPWRGGRRVRGQGRVGAR